MYIVQLSSTYKIEKLLSIDSMICERDLNFLHKLFNQLYILFRVMFVVAEMTGFDK